VMSITVVDYILMGYDVIGDTHGHAEKAGGCSREVGVSEHGWRLAQAQSTGYFCR
jgi:hypothetical protein